MSSRSKQSVFAWVVLALISSAGAEPIPKAPSVIANVETLNKRATNTTASGNDTETDDGAWNPSKDDIYNEWDDLTDPYGQYDTYTLNINGDYLENDDLDESNDGDFGFDSPLPDPEAVEYVSNITTVRSHDIAAQSEVLKQEPDFSAAGTLEWLENWIKNNMSQVNYDNQEFISAFLDSIRPIWNGADPDR